MKISTLSKFALILLILFLLFKVVKINGWYLHFWFAKLAYILFFIISMIIFFRPNNRKITKILSYFFPINLLLVSIAFITKGIFMALVVGLLLFPLAGPELKSENTKFVIQKPFQGFLGSSTKFELIKKYYIFEKKLHSFQTEEDIKSFNYDENSNRLIINNNEIITSFEN